MYVRAAGPLTVTVLSIAISNIFKLYKAPHNIAIVGEHSPGEQGGPLCRGEGEQPLQFV